MQRFTPFAQSSFLRVKNAQEQEVHGDAPQLVAVTTPPVADHPQSEPGSPLATGQPVHVQIPERRFCRQAAAVTIFAHEAVHVEHRELMMKLNIAFGVNALSMLVQIDKHDEVAVVERKTQVVAANLPERVNTKHGAGVHCEDRFAGDAAETWAVPLRDCPKHEAIGREPPAARCDLRNDGAHVWTISAKVRSRSHAKKVVARDCRVLVERNQPIRFSTDGDFKRPIVGRGQAGIARVVIVRNAFRQIRAALWRWAVVPKDNEEVGFVRGNI